MNPKEIRWKQRFQNFAKAFEILERTARVQQLSEIERAGLIQFFEIEFELSWHTMKDYLESLGFLVKTLRETIKQAFQIELISDGETWLRALEDHNLTTHIYDEALASQIERVIRENYLPIIRQLYERLQPEAQR